MTDEERAQKLIGDYCHVSEHDNLGSVFCEECGRRPVSEIREALAEVRAEGAREERAKILKWLRYPCPCEEADCSEQYEGIAASIERGDHEPIPSEA